jgi:hypothetical protein
MLLLLLARRRSCGIGLFWNIDQCVDVLGYSQYHIDVSF